MGKLWRASLMKKLLASWKGPKELSHSLCCHRHTCANTHKHTHTHTHTHTIITTLPTLLITPKVNPHLRRLKLKRSNTECRCSLMSRSSHQQYFTTRWLCYNHQMFICESMLTEIWTTTYWLHNVALNTVIHFSPRQVDLHYYSMS